MVRSHWWILAVANYVAPSCIPKHEMDLFTRPRNELTLFPHSRLQISRGQRYQRSICYDKNIFTRYGIADDMILTIPAYLFEPHWSNHTIPCGVVP